MPRRYYGGSVDPRELQDMAGGNPFYNPTMSHPDWGAGIRSTLNQMYALKEARRLEAEEKRRWEAESARAERQAQSGIKREEAMAEYYLGEGRGKKQAAPPIDRVGFKQFIMNSPLPPDRKQALADSLDYVPDNQLPGLYERLTEQYLTPPKEPKVEKPDTFDKKRSFLDGALKRGEISPAQYNQALGGVQPEKQPEGLTTYQKTQLRNNSMKIISDYDASLIQQGLKSGYTISGFDEKSLREMSKKTGGRAVTPDGVPLDVPRNYRIAKLNIGNGVAKPEEEAYVDKTDKNFAIFENISKYFKNFNEFMGSQDQQIRGMIKDPDVDKNLLKFWFEVYKGK